jgi:hypothetical protein
MKSNFYYGVGLGMAMGAALDRVTRPTKKKSKVAGKAMKLLGSMVEDAADLLR